MPARKQVKPKGKKAPIGRPSSYKPEYAEQIVAKLVEGKSLRAACEGITDPATACRWLANEPHFRECYARAREGRADLRHEQMDDVISDMRAGIIDAAQARVELDKLKWQAAKEAPSRYGDKASVELTGKDGGAVQTRHEIVFVTPEAKA